MVFATRRLPTCCHIFDLRVERAKGINSHEGSFKRQLSIVENFAVGGLLGVAIIVGSIIVVSDADVEMEVGVVDATNVVRAEGIVIVVDGAAVADVAFAAAVVSVALAGVVITVGS